MNKIKYANRFFLALILTHLGLVFAFTFGYIAFGIEVNTTASLLISQMSIIIPGFLYFAVTKQKIRDVIPFRKIKISTVFMVVLFTVFLSPTMTLINALSMLFFSNATGEISNTAMQYPLVISLLMIGVLPAFGEEFVYRGIMHHTYRRRGILLGALVSGALFGIMHMNFNQFSYAFFLGIAFGLLVEATGSIFASMIAHFVVNGSSVFLLWLLNFIEERFEGFQEIAQSAETAEVVLENSEQMLGVVLVYLIIAAFTLPIAIGIYFWIADHCGRRQHVRNIFKRKDTIRQMSEFPGRVSDVHQDKVDGYRADAFKMYNNNMNEYEMDEGNRNEHMVNDYEKDRYKTDYYADYNIEENNSEGNNIDFNMNDSNIRKTKERIVTPTLVIACILCFAYMILMELL